MARKVQSKELDSKSARAKLTIAAKPYYREVGQGLHLGFRKGKRSGTWVARFYAGNQTYRIESIGAADDDKNDADGVNVLTFNQAIEKARERQKARTTAGGEVAGPYTVAQAVEDYLEAISAKPSAHDARTRAETWILPTLGKTDAALLTAKQIRTWLNGIAESGRRVRPSKNGDAKVSELDADDAEAVRRRRSTANRTLTILKAALNFAFNEGKTVSDKEWRRVKPFKGVEAARVRYLEISEARRLLNACSPEFRLLVQAALETGARYSELARLKVADFNHDSETLAILVSKSGNSRHVELSDDGVAFFTQVTLGRSGDELMFNHGGQPWRKSEQSRPMAAACRRAKIDPPIGFHGLRHTWASHAVMNGTPLLVVAKNLGHSDTRMVERHYGHHPASYVRDAIRKGAPRFGFKPDKKVARLAGRA